MAREWLAPDKRRPNAATKRGTLAAGSSSRAKAAVVESEFLVLRQNKLTAEYDLQRVLMLGTTRIVEADVERGENVVTLDTSDLCGMELIEFADADMGPVITCELACQCHETGQFGNFVETEQYGFIGHGSPP